jgi:hypothetical protein
VVTGAILDSVSFLDIVILVATILASIAGGPAGVAISVASIPIIGNETAQSLHDNC